MLDPLVRRAVRRLGRQRLQIFIFHRVHAHADPLYPSEVSADEFDRICRWMASWFQVMALDEAVQALGKGVLPDGAACITFDDGYADNHDVALPILRRHGLCATFFIATDYLDGGRMWNDTVVEALRGATVDTIDVSDLGLGSLHELPCASMQGRRDSVRQALSALKYLEPAHRQEMALELARRACSRLPDHLMLTSAQVRGLHAFGMQIGAHTASHPILARVDAQDSFREMQDSRDRLMQLVGQPVNLFAYPNGIPGTDFLPRDVELARRAGFKAAVTTAWGSARPGCDPLQLPRFTPWDRSRLGFAARVARNYLSS